MIRPLIPLVVLLACKDKDADDTAAAQPAVPLSDCDPIAPTLCGLPFPSTFYMRPDETSATGWRVHLGETTLPIDANGLQPAPTLWNERDGWSVSGALLAHLPGVTVTGVAGHDDIGASVADDSLSLIVDVDTGERMPHFVELDMTHDDETQRMLLIRPVAPLRYGHHYAVGLRGLVDSGGAPVAPSDAFLALRDGTTTDNSDVEGRRAWYDDVVFPALTGQGWTRGDVQLAWDFVTGSKEGITGKMVCMRDDALDRVGAEGPPFTIDEVVTFTPEQDANTARRVYGSMTVPLYTDKDGTNTLLTRDADGMPTYNGDTTVPFTVIIPQSLITDPHPAPIVQYGHGLFGSQDEVEAGYLAELANQHGWIILAVDWTGMKAEDALSAAAIIATGIDRFGAIPERSQQGFVEALCAMRLAMGALGQDEALMAADPETGEMVTLIDPETRYYDGNSPGGIMGGAYMALSTDVSRGVLGVAGMPYNLLLDRSHDFDTFFGMFRTMFPDPLTVTYLLGLTQTLWDSGEPAGYARAMFEDPLPDTPEKQILIQVGIGDNQVTTLGAAFMARAYGASLLETPVREIWGLDTVASPTTGPVLVEWDYGLTEPVFNVPPDEPDPHEWVRREPDAQEMLATFLSTGEIVQTCDGTCTAAPHE